MTYPDILDDNGMIDFTEYMNLSVEQRLEYDAIRNAIDILRSSRRHWRLMPVVGLLPLALYLDMKILDIMPDTAIQELIENYPR